MAIVIKKATITPTRAGVVATEIDTNSDRMSSDEIESMLNDLLHVLGRLAKIKASIPDAPTQGLKDALLSNAKVDIHNGRWELNKACQHLISALEQ